MNFYFSFAHCSVAKISKSFKLSIRETKWFLKIPGGPKMT